MTHYQLLFEKETNKRVWVNEKGKEQLNPEYKIWVLNRINDLIK